MSPLVKDRTEHIRFRHAVYMVISFVLILWIVKAIELASGTTFSSLGVLPRTLKGAIGIITGPLIHGDIFHLISNTLPIILLGVLLFYFYQRIAIEIFIWIYFVTGFWTWILARSAYHIGASGIVYGMASFLLFSGFIRKSKQLMTVSAIIIFLYGGIIYGIFPETVELNVSWESHLMGFIVGIILSILFRSAKIDFDQESEDEEPIDETDSEDYFRHTSSTDSRKGNYIFKSKDDSK